MNILIIGGTGKTGKHLIAQCLEKGHRVTALVRNPSKIKIRHPNLKWIQGDVLDPASLEKAFPHQEAVLCALGHKRFIVKTSILSRGTENIIQAMKAHDVKRFVCITSLGINESRYRMGVYYTFFVIPFILYFYFKDKEKQERLIEQSLLDWTIVQPAQLIPFKLKSKYQHGEGIGHLLITKMISRADVAHFMLQELQYTVYLHKKPGLAY